MSEMFWRHLIITQKKCCEDLRGLPNIFECMAKWFKIVPGAFGYIDSANEVGKFCDVITRMRYVATFCQNI